MTESLYNMGLEQSVLVALMTSERVYDGVGHLLTTSDFYALRHQVIFGAIQALAKTQTGYDAVAVKNHLVSANRLQDVGGEKYLTQLLAEVPMIFNLPANVQMLNDLRQRRAVEESCKQLMAAVSHMGTPVDQLAEQAILQIGEAARGERGDAEVYPLEAARTMMDYVTSGAIAGTPTGYVELDNKLGGFAGGQMIIIAARPAMGKSVLALNLADQISQGSGKLALFIQLEMLEAECTLRLVCGHAKVPMHIVKQASINDDMTAKDFERFSQATQNWQENGKVVICTKGVTSPTGVAAMARRLHRKHGLSCVVVDYLQLMRLPNGQGGDNRNTEITEISRALKQLAMELNIPVIALSQLNRGVESRSDKRPLLSDLRESGAIEQDADVVLMLYRECVYDENADPHSAEVLIRKQRQGALGTVPMEFYGQWARFESAVTRGAT